MPKPYRKVWELRLANFDTAIERRKQATQRLYEATGALPADELMTLQQAILSLDDQKMRLEAELQAISDLRDEAHELRSSAAELRREIAYRRRLLQQRTQEREDAA